MKQNLYFLTKADTHYSQDIIGVGFVRYEYISINNNAEMPYEKTSLFANKHKEIHFGDLFEIVNDTFITNYNYKDHEYDLAVVLGEDKTNQKLLVFGNKIGEQIIDKKNNPNHNYTFHQRGDKLLLKNTDKGYQIIHNLTQAKLKYNMKQMVK